MCRAVVLLAIATILFTPPTGSARTWQDSTGKFRVEAEFVDLKGDIVRLKKADDQVISVPLERLSEADRKFLKEQSKGSEGAAAEDLKIDVKSEWSPFPSFGEDGKPAGHKLELSVFIRGEQATQASAFGKLELDPVKDDAGRPLEAKLGGMHLSGEEMVPVKRDDFFAKHPKDGLRIPIEIASPGPIKRLDAVSGTITLRTGGEYETITVEKATNHVGKPFEQSEIKLEIGRGKGDSETAGLAGFGAEAAEMVTVDVGGDLQSLVEVMLTDPKGKPLDTAITGTSGFGKNMTYSFGLEKPLPEDAQLRLTLHKDAKEVAVPFAAKDVKVPPVPKAGAAFPFDFKANGTQE